MVWADSTFPIVVSAKRSTECASAHPTDIDVVPSGPKSKAGLSSQKIEGGKIYIVFGLA
jgi:hypothetical protein